MKAAGLAGILVVVVATAGPGLMAAELNNAVREGQPVVTELSVKASAITYSVSEPDGWRVVTTVDALAAAQAPSLRSGNRSGSRHPSV